MLKRLWLWLIGTDAGIALLIFFAASSITYATAAGITSSNDGSHYALVRAIVDDGSFEISSYMDFTEEVDFSFLGDKRFTDRPPATAMVGAMFYALGSISPPPPAEMPSKHDPDNPILVYLLIAPAVCMAAAMSISYLLFRTHLEVSRVAAAITAVGLAVGTPSWKYGSVLYSHGLDSLLMIAALYLIFEMQGRDQPALKHVTAIGFLIGLSMITEYTSAIFVLFAGGYLVFHYGGSFVTGVSSPHKRREWLTLLGGLAVGGGIPLIFLAAYNTINFGGPLELSSVHVNTALWPQDASITGQFTTPLWVGFPAMLFYGQGNQGLFYFMPISVFGLFGVLPLWKKSRARAILLIGTFVVFLVVISTRYAFNPGTNDSRYLTPFLPMWFAAVAVGIDWLIRASNGKRLWAVVIGIIVVGLLLLSITFQFRQIAISWGHDTFASQTIGLLFGAVFTNWRNLPVIWLFEIIVLFAFGMFIQWRRARRYYAEM